MLNFLWRVFWDNNNIVYYEDDILVFNGRKLTIKRAKFKKDIETEEIFIQLSNKKWKNIEEVFNIKAIPRIRKKSLKILNSSD